jgi:membrane-associated phospholipid phosphatase
LVGGLRRPSLDSRSHLLLAGLGFAFTALAILVAIGSLSGVDQWSVEHLMPGLTPGSGKPSLLGSLVPIFHPGKEHGHVAVAALTYGIVWIASVVPSVLLVGAALLYLRSRGRERLACRLGIVFVAVNVFEVVGKALVTRPALYSHEVGARIHVLPFDSSFPSGHAIRAVLLVTCLAACFPRLKSVGLAWLVAVSVMLVVGGWHTPSDVASGLLLATGGCLLAFTGLQDGERRIGQGQVEVTPL